MQHVTLVTQRRPVKLLRTLLLWPGNTLVLKFAMCFTPEACAEASFQKFNQETSTIEEDGNESVDDRDRLDAFGH